MKFGVKEMRNELMEKAGEELEKKERKGKRAELKREVKKSESGNEVQDQEETRDELIGRRKVEKRRKERK